MNLSCRKWIALLGLWLGCWAAGVAQAARVSELYSAELLVAQQAVQVEAGQAAAALAQVLVRVSGQQQVVERPELQQGLNQAQRYIQQFRFVQSQQPIETDDGREVLAQRLTIDFDRALVNQLLAQAGMRPLGAIRPGVLVWLLEERNGQPVFSGGDEDPVFVAMSERARQRGLPLFRPLLDMDDQLALPVSDAWGFFTDSIIQASGRYQADAVLVGRLYTGADNSRQSQWLLIKPQGQSHHFEGQGDGLDDHLSSAVDQTSDQLFADFISPIDGLDPEALLLEVEGLNTIRDYFLITEYLDELPIVKSLTLVQLNDDRLRLKLELEGSIGQLRGSLGLNARFEALPLDQAQEGQLYYRWRR